MIFDYGGVLTTPVGDSIRAWLDRDGIDPGSFSRTLKAWLGRSAPDGTPIHQLEVGALTIDEFDELLAAELTLESGGRVEPQGLSRSLFAELQVDENMFDLVSALRDAGLKVGLLSNSWGNTYPRARIGSLFDSIVISGEVGMRKPNSDIYQHSLATLDVLPENAVFIDDAEPNVEGANRVGMRGILHADYPTTRHALAELGIDMSRTNGREMTA